VSKMRRQRRQEREKERERGRKREREREREGKEADGGRDDGLINLGARVASRSDRDEGGREVGLRGRTGWTRVTSHESRL